MLFTHLLTQWQAIWHIFRTNHVIHQRPQLKGLFRGTLAEAQMQSKPAAPESQA